MTPEGLFASLFVACTLTCLAVSEECKLPVPEEPVQWDKVTGDWYLILDIGLPIDDVSKCFGSRNYVTTKQGFNVTVVDYHLRNMTYGEIPMSYTKLSDGTFAKDVEQKTKWKYELDEDAGSLVKRKEIANHHAAALTKNHVSILTDYETYVLNIVCLRNVEKSSLEAPDWQIGIWIHSHSTDPTVEEILAMVNKLKEIGLGRFQLYTSGCKSAKDLKSFIKE